VSDTDRRSVSVDSSHEKPKARALEPPGEHDVRVHPASLPNASPQTDVHEFRLQGPEEVDDEVALWLAEAYRVGRQEHL
jgi:hypothetical protein